MTSTGHSPGVRLLGGDVRKLVRRIRAVRRRHQIRTGRLVPLDIETYDIRCDITESALEEIARRLKS